MIAGAASAAGKYQFQIVTRPPGAALGSGNGRRSPPTKPRPAGIHVAIDESGDIGSPGVSATPNSELTPDPFFVMATVRPAGGAFSSPKRISPPEPKHADAPMGEEPAQKQARYEQEVKEWSKRRLTAAGRPGRDRRSRGSPRGLVISGRHNRTHSGKSPPDQPDPGERPSRRAGPSRRTRRSPWPVRNRTNRSPASTPRARRSWFGATTRNSKRRSKP